MADTQPASTKPDATDSDAALLAITRLIVAALAIPVAGVVAYYIALYFNGDATTISSNGSAIGAILVVAATFGVSRLAHDVDWSTRAGTAIALATAYFLLTWVRFGDPELSPDAQPHIVWFGLCVVAFMPTVVIIPASKWAWSAYRARLRLG